jgi:hypothetical protein
LAFILEDRPSSAAVDEGISAALPSSGLATDLDHLERVACLREVAVVEPLAVAEVVLATLVVVAATGLRSYFNDK